MKAGGLRVGALVMVVRTAHPEVDGKVGEVVAGPIDAVGVDAFTNRIAAVNGGWIVAFPEPVLEQPALVLQPQHLVPLNPPDGTCDEHAAEGLGIGALV